MYTQKYNFNSFCNRYILRLNLFANEKCISDFRAFVLTIRLRVRYKRLCCCDIFKPAKTITLP